MRSRPFGPVRGMLGKDGERWVPIHAVFPLSEAARVLDANDAYFAGRREFMALHGIVYSVMTMTTRRLIGIVALLNCRAALPMAS